MKLMPMKNRDASSKMKNIEKKKKKNYDTSISNIPPSTTTGGNWSIAI